MIVRQAPTPYWGMPRPWLFLAGSIEMGAAEDWQTQVTAELVPAPGTILNPRRDDWDSSWTQHPDFGPFRQQVLWELAALKEADTILLVFDPATKSPISLLELGLHARGGKLIVACPEAFWRWGNVALVCETYGVPLYASWQEALPALMRGPT